MTLIQKRLLGMGFLVLTGAAGAGVIYWQDQKSTTDALAERQDKQVMTVRDATKVRSLELTTPGGSFTLEREGGADGQQHWTLVTPQRTPADDTTIDGIVEHLTQLERQGQVGVDKQGKPVGTPPQPKNFGLEPPVYKVTLGTSDGQKDTLFIGEKSSFDGSMYVMKPDGAAIYTVPGALEYQVDKDLFKLRDKRLAVFGIDEVKSFKVTTEGKTTYAVSKTADKYELTEPVATLGDSVQLSSLLTSLTSVTAKSMVAEQPLPADLTRYGFSDPKVIAVDLELEKGPLHVAFSEVKAGKERRYYARAAQGPIIELSSEWAQGKLLVPADELRDKHVLNFEREELGKVVLERGTQKLVFTKSDKAEGGETWQMVEPENAKAQDAKVAALVYRLWNLKAKHVHKEKAEPADLTAGGFDTPAAQVELFKKDGQPMGVISFGSVQKDEQLVTSGTRIDVVDKTAADEVSTTVADYKEVPTAQK